MNKSRWHCVYRYKWSDKDLQDIGDKISKVSDDVDPQNKTYIDFKSAISDLKSPSEIGNLYTHHITSTIDSIIQKKKVLPPKDRPKWFDIECRTQRNLLVSLNRENESITNIAGGCSGGGGDNKENECSPSCDGLCNQAMDQLSALQVSHV